MAVLHITLVRPDLARPEVVQQKTYKIEDMGLASISTVLQHLARTVDSSIGYYLSCRRGMCACCVVRANGKIATACVTPVADGMVIEPIRLDIQVQDTVVDLSMAKDHQFQFEGEAD